MGMTQPGVRDPAGNVYNKKNLPAADRKFKLDYDFVSSGTDIMLRGCCQGIFEREDWFNTSGRNDSIFNTTKNRIIEFDMEPILLSIWIFSIGQPPTGIRDDDEYTATPVKFYPPSWKIMKPALYNCSACASASAIRTVSLQAKCCSLEKMPTMKASLICPIA